MISVVNQIQIQVTCPVQYGYKQEYRKQSYGDKGL